MAIYDQSGIPDMKQPDGLSSKDVKRPDGMSLILWLNLKSVVWDVTVINIMAVINGSRHS